MTRKKEFPLAGASLYSQPREGGWEERRLSQELSEKWGDMVTNSSTKRQVCQGSRWSDVYGQESGLKTRLSVTLEYPVEVNLSDVTRSHRREEDLVTR